jgi:anthrone oxygenase-like protein
MVGYTISAWSLSRSSRLIERRDWRMFALGALLHFSVAVHSVVNMVPLNHKLAAEPKPRVQKASDEDENNEPVIIARRWMNLNLYRIVAPFASGPIAIWQTMIH